MTIIKRGRPNEVARTIAQMRRRRGEPIWEQLSDGVEIDQQFARFRVYRDLGPSRSLLALASVLGYEARTVPCALAKMCRDYSWAERVEAFDDWIAQTQATALEEALAEQAQMWAQRQIQMREDNYQLGSLMLQLVKSRLNKANGIEIDEEGNVKQITPERLNIPDKDLPRFARTAVDLMHSALDMASSADWRDMPDPQGLLLPPTLPDDLHEASDEQLTRAIEWHERHKRLQQSQTPQQSIEPGESGEGN